MHIIIIANNEKLHWRLPWNHFHLKLWFQIGRWMIEAWNDQKQLEAHWKVVQEAITEIQRNAKLLAQSPTPAQFWIAHRHELQFATTKTILQPLIANQTADWNPIIQDCQTWLNNLSYCWLHQNATNKLTILAWFCRLQSQLIAPTDFQTIWDFQPTPITKTEPVLTINFDEQTIHLQPPPAKIQGANQAKIKIPKSTPTLMTKMSFSEFLMWSAAIQTERWQALWLKDQEIATLYQLN